MTFAVFADGTANLPGKLLEGIQLLPSELTINGTSYTYTGDIEHLICIPTMRDYVMGMM